MYGAPVCYSTCPLCIAVFCMLQILQVRLHAFYGNLFKLALWSVLTEVLGSELMRLPHHLGSSWVYLTNLLGNLLQSVFVFSSITDEAGASIYSVSPEAVKEMPDLDPNLRSAGDYIFFPSMYKNCIEHRNLVMKNVKIDYDFKSEIKCFIYIKSTYNYLNYSSGKKSTFFTFRYYLE